MTPTHAPLPDANALVQRLKQGLTSLLSAQSAHLVGIASGGAWLARQLHGELGLPGRCSVVSSSLHRDDFSTRGFANAERTDIAFDINGAHVILVDDVLYTGRTIRAVINELYDHGRPASVRLAVLVDRGGRQLPIQPDFAAHTEALAVGRSLALRRGTAADEAAPGFHLRWKD